jgi:hypothetical protein
MSADTIYFHFDVESNGPSPLTSSMLELGICATNPDGTEVGSLCVNFFEVEGMTGTRRVKQWLRDAKIYDRLYNHPERLSPSDGMKKVQEFVKSFPGKKIMWIAYPAAYDWMWLRSYWDKYLEGDETCGYTATCLSTLINNHFANYLSHLTDENNLPLEFNVFKLSLCNPSLPLTHNGLDDARHQAWMFHSFMKNYVHPLSVLHARSSEMNYA